MRKTVVRPINVPMPGARQCAMLVRRVFGRKRIRKKGDDGDGRRGAAGRA